jgi:hypothetical protein
MARLGIPTTLRVMDDRVQTKPTRPRKLAAKIEFDPESLRRSGRHLGHTPDYTGESIDQLGDADVKVQVGNEVDYSYTILNVPLTMLKTPSTMLIVPSL